MRFLTIMVLSLLATACATTAFQSPTSSPVTWQGKSANLLIQQLGTPDLITPSPNGNTFFAYTKETSKAYLPSSNVNTTTFVGPKGKVFSTNIPTPPDSTHYIALKCTTIYEVNKQHVIVSKSEKGNGCR